MISKLSIESFTVFSEVECRFGGLNVIHGENSSGKTHLLKLAYALATSLIPRPNEAAPDRPTKAWLEPILGAKLNAIFRPDGGKVGRLVRRARGEGTATIDAQFDRTGRLEYHFRRRSDRTVTVTKVPTGWMEQAPVYFPTRELLSVYPGFVSLYETQTVPFDETWRDTCLLLGAPVARGPRKAEIAALLEPIEMAIGCKTILDGDRFFLVMSDGAKVEADLVAEGYRKLSMVARLIANGSLDDKGYLFWDEPEANLNPRLVKRLAPLLIDLAIGGVQIFIATHSLFLMRELEIERQKRGDTSVPMRFLGLHPDEDGVRVEQGDTIEASGDIAALDENLEQSERFMALEG